MNLIDLIRRGLLSGTDPASPAYWGPITDYDQRMVEAADVAAMELLEDGLGRQIRSVARRSAESNGP
ncbi:MAG: DUF2264 domain-containing protein [Gemmatimonadota bacterium]|nr:DUF2264 domain-containing protein [Gemmatimonadota bacterium]